MKQILIGTLGLIFLASLIFVQAMEVIRRREEAGLARHRVAVPNDSKAHVFPSIRIRPRRATR
jgi:hypothetical protein